MTDRSLGYAVGRDAWRWLGPIVVGLTLFGLLPWLYYVTIYPVALDGHAYYVAQLGHLYSKGLGDGDGLLYAPTFTQVIEPLRWLGWDGFRTAWRLIEVGRASCRERVSYHV